MCETYDIYIANDVEELKKSYEQLRQLYKQVIHENAKLQAEVDKLRQRRREEDWEWMTI